MGVVDIPGHDHPCLPIERSVALGAKHLVAPFDLEDTGGAAWARPGVFEHRLGSLDVLLFADVLDLFAVVLFRLDHVAATTDSGLTQSTLLSLFLDEPLASFRRTGEDVVVTNSVRIPSTVNVICKALLFQIKLPLLLQQFFLLSLCVRDLLFYLCGDHICLF